MNPDTRLEFPIDTVPKNGTMYSINDDLHWVRMPLPMSLKSYQSMVNRFKGSGNACGYWNVFR